MEIPAILKGDSLTRLLQGAAFGAIATMVVGFNWAGWTLGSTAAKMSEDSARQGMVSALAPICVDKFQRADNSPAKLVELKKLASYQQASFVETNGWATAPGSDKSNTAVAQACATMLNNLK